MKYFLALVGAAVISLLAYLLVFGFLVSRPMVVDQIQDFMDKKIAYAQATPHPKLFVVAGSNARFSHSCAVLEELLKRPCVNMGIAGDVALDWTLEKVRRELAPGDAVYMPVEYDLYSRPRERFLTGMDAAYRFRHDKASLLPRGPEGIVRAAFMFSLPTLVQSLGEMGLKSAGVRRRFNVDTMDKQGDETGHDGAKADAYAAVIRQEAAILPDTPNLLANSDGSQAAIAGFLDWCRTHKVAVIGGLPTVFDDNPVPDAAIARLVTFYAAHGARFVALPGRSQYPRAYFYDSSYHLRQSAQMRHSRLLAEALRPLL